MLFNANLPVWSPREFETSQYTVHFRLGVKLGNTRQLLKKKVGQRAGGPKWERKH